MSYVTRKFGRRIILRGLSGTIIGLPFCPSLRRAHAEPQPPALGAAGTPLGLVAVMTPNGVLRRKWMPEGEGLDVRLAESFAPIAHLKQRMIVFRDVDNPIPKGAAADLHRQSLGLWTGGARKADMSAIGPSFDTFVASRLATPSAPDVLRLGVQSPGAIGVSAVSYDESGRPKLGNNSPRNVFKQLFNQTPGGPGGPDPLKRSVLDDVLADYNRAAGQMNAPDRLRVEAHLTAVREVERLLAQSSQSCNQPGDPSAWPTHGGVFDSYNDPALTQQLMVAQFDLAALALSCGRARVVAIMVLQEGAGGSTANYPWLDPSLADHHEASHQQKDVLALADRYNLERTAQLVNRLDEFGLGRSTLVVQGSGLSNGAAHDSVDLPIVMIGDLGGRLRTGRLVRGGRRKYNDVILTVLHAFGLPVASFGEAARCTGPFTEVLA